MAPPVCFSKREKNFFQTNFNLVDTEHVGFIPVGDLSKAMSFAGYKTKSAELQEMIRAVVPAPKRVITFANFLDLIALKIEGLPVGPVRGLLTQYHEAKELADDLKRRSKKRKFGSADKMFQKLHKAQHDCKNKRKLVLASRWMEISSIFELEILKNLNPVQSWRGGVLRITGDDKKLIAKVKKQALKAKLTVEYYP